MRLAPLAILAMLTTAPPVLSQSVASGRDATIYELRTYYPAPGKLDALNARFRNHTLRLFEKHGMRNVAYWNDQPSKDFPEGRVIYVLAYPSREAREASWKAFGVDPEWRAVVTSSEASGKLVVKVDSVFMTLTDYSPKLRIGAGPG